MRLLSGLVLAAVVLACSSESTSGQTPSSQDGGPSSSSGGSSGGGSSGTPSGGDVVKTTTENVDGRKYILSVPTDYDAGKKYPLWIFMSGDPVSAEGAAGFQLHNVSKNEAIIAYPSAAEQAWGHDAVFVDNADVTFILAMIGAIAGKYSVDTGRVLLDGWSNGAFMASAMACRYSAKFRAIGSHAGGAPYNGADPSSAPDCAGASIAAFITHGEADTTVPFDTYTGQYWQEHNGCSANRSASTPAPCETYDGCPAGKPVKVCYVPGLGHPVWDQAFVAEWAWFKSLP